MAVLREYHAKGDRAAFYAALKEDPRLAKVSSQLLLQIDLELNKSM